MVAAANPPPPDPPLSPYPLFTTYRHDTNGRHKAGHDDFRGWGEPRSGVLSAPPAGFAGLALDRSAALGRQGDPRRQRHEALIVVAAVERAAARGADDEALRAAARSTAATTIRASCR